MTGRPLTVHLPVSYPLFGVQLALDPGESGGRREWFVAEEPELIVGWVLHWNVVAEQYSVPLPIFVDSGEGGSFFSIGPTPREAVQEGERRAKWLTENGIGVQPHGRI